MIFDRMTVFKVLFPQARAAARTARRWQAARLREPLLMADVLALGQVLALQPRQSGTDGTLPVPIDPQRLAYEAGRRDIALELAALMGVSNHELSLMLEKNDVEID
jgi:hypothetical protein